MKLLKDILEQLITKEPLSTQQVKWTMQKLMAGELNDCEIAAFLALTRAKGHTVEELTAAAEEIMEHAKAINIGQDMVDLVGTGGDGLNTFNISTFASFVVAGAGIKVAKHGNRSVSSKSGSSNVLDCAGIRLSQNTDELREQLSYSGICFLFAPWFHPALKYAIPARNALGIRTFFNLLGPLLNPARVKKQVIGVFSSEWLLPISQVLENLGSKRHLVLSAEDGMDEISVTSPTTILEFKNGERHHWTLNPENFEMAHSSLEEILVNSPEESLEIGLSVLGGKAGCAYDIVCLNAASAIYCHDQQINFEQAVDMARLSIDSGQALLAFHKLQQLCEKDDDA